MTTSNFENGISTDKKGKNLGAFILPDFTKAHTYFKDFDDYLASEWVVTETQVGATQAIANADGGILELVNSAADDDLNSIQKANETYTFESGKKTFPGSE